MFISYGSKNQVWKENEEQFFGKDKVFFVEENSSVIWNCGIELNTKQEIKKYLSLENLTKLLNCEYIEFHKISHNHIMICNENGRLENEYNQLMTQLFCFSDIYGKCIVVPEKYVRKYM